MSWRVNFQCLIDLTCMSQKKLLPIAVPTSVAHLLGAVFNKLACIWCAATRGLIDSISPSPLQVPKGTEAKKLIPRKLARIMLMLYLKFCILYFVVQTRSILLIDVLKNSAIAIVMSSYLSAFFHQSPQLHQLRSLR
jgi:hypothetical protein